VDLIYEGMVRATRGLSGLRYEPALAEGSPRLTPLGRQFQIAPGTYWSNGEPVTAADVRHTVRLLNNKRWAGYNPALAKMLEDVPLVSDAARVTVTLKQGFVDPCR
jgi:ABC-type transport system substrate-binding protein